MVTYKIINRIWIDSGSFTFTKCSGLVSQMIGGTVVGEEISVGVDSRGLGGRTTSEAL